MINENTKRRLADEILKLTSRSCFSSDYKVLRELFDIIVHGPASLTEKQFDKLFKLREIQNYELDTPENRTITYTLECNVCQKIIVPRYFENEEEKEAIEKMIKEQVKRNMLFDLNENLNKCLEEDEKEGQIDEHKD